MENDYLGDNPWIGQQPDEVDHVIDYLNSNQGIMFPTHEFVDSPEVYADEIRQPLQEYADADDDIPPLILPPALDDFDVDFEEILNVSAYLSLAEDCSDYIFEPLLNALRPLQGLPSILIMPVHFLLLNLYRTITGMKGRVLRRLLPVVLVEVAERYKPGAGFLVNVVVGLTPHILEQLRPIALSHDQRLARCGFSASLYLMRFFCNSTASLRNREKSETAFPKRMLKVA